jgi:branched-chain amino acid transport system ATP-binding protein
MDKQAEPVLRVSDIHSYYGNIQALHGISLEVYQGEIVTLIGANGAGKTTTIRTISGIIKPRQGEIYFNGQRIDGKPAHDLVGMGISQSPEGRRIFPRLTVLDNLEMGAFLRRDTEIQADIQMVFGLFPRLKERIKQYAGTLSGGEQQMLAMGRAMMARPKLLLLDEPSMGLAPVLVEQIFEIITQINKTNGTTILLVEQNALMALEVASRGYVLQSGAILQHGTGDQLLNDETIRKAYLGAH